MVAALPMGQSAIAYHLDQPFLGWCQF